VYAWNEKTFGPNGMLGRLQQKDDVLTNADVETFVD